MKWIELLLDFLLKRRPVVPVPPPAPPQPAPVQTLLEAVNAYRVRQGMPPFIADSCLTAQASLHAADVWTGIVNPHDGFAQRLRTCAKGAGAENWAQSDSASRAVAMWQTSAGHRANMLGRYTYAAGAIVEESAVLIVGNVATRDAGLSEPIVDSSNEHMTCARIEQVTKGG